MINRKTNRKVTSEETKQKVAAFVNLHKGIFSANTLARQFKIAPTTMARICKELNLDIKSYPCGKYGGRIAAEKEVEKEEMFSFKKFKGGIF